MYALPQESSGIVCSKHMPPAILTRPVTDARMRQRNPHRAMGLKLPPKLNFLTPPMRKLQENQNCTNLCTFFCIS